MKIKVIGLDLGMVVLCFQHELACCRLSRLTGLRLSASEIYRRVFESGLNAAMDLGMPLDEIVRELRQAIEVEASPEEIVQAFCDIFWVNSDVCDALAFVPCDIKLILGSNTNAAHAGFVRREFAPILASLDAQVMSHEIFASKPAARFFQRFVETAGCRPGEILFLDDRADNIQGAAACGLATVHYTPGVSFREELLRHGVALASQRVR